MPVIDHERWKVLEPLLDQALDLTLDERSSWLQDLSTSSPDVAAEFSALLAGEATAEQRGFLIDRVTPTLEGLQLGAYTIDRPLGEGGMGSVWLARRTDGRFEGVVAVKILNLSLLSAAGQARFKREGSVLSRLAHPGIARLLDAGVTPAGQPYLVLEHVDGTRIDRFVEERGLSTDERIRLFLRVLAAVGHAHANLIVHRDLKPSNILVTADGSVKLLDFGIAKLLDEDSSSERTAVTIEGGRALTPEFAAPEQVRGEPITTATDIYSSGVLLYLLLSGRHPTAEGSRTPAEAIRALLEKEPRRLGLGDVDNVVAKALRPAPSERYLTVAAFAGDLERYLGHEPVSARRDSFLYRGRKFLRRNRGAVTAAAIAVGALLTATVFSISQMREARRQRDAALRDARRAAAMTELQRVLTGDERRADGQPRSAAERIAQAEQVLTRQYRSEPWLVSEIMTDLSGQFYEIGNRDAQRSMLERSRAIAREENLGELVALASCTRASSFVYDDLTDSARIDLAEARDALQLRREPLDPATEIVCLIAEGKVLWAMDSRDSAITRLKQAVSVSAADRHSTLRLETLNELGELLRLSGRTREAVPYQLQVLSELDSTGQFGTDLISNVLSFLVASLNDLGELATLDSVITSYVRRHEQLSGHAPPMLAFMHGHNKLRLGELDSAEAWIGRAMTDTMRNAHWRVVTLPAALVQLRLEQRRFAEAQRAVLSPPEGTLGRRAASAMLRAGIRFASGERQGAATLLEGELRALSTDGRPPLTLFTLPFVTAGQWRLAAGDARGADSLARLARSAAGIDSMAAGRSAMVGRAMLLRAQSLRALGDQAGARDAARQATAALTFGLGPSRRWTLAAKALRDSLGA